MTPPPALAGTVPPGKRKSLDSEIAEINGRARRKKLAVFAGLAALVVGGYYARDKLGHANASAPPPETAGLRATAKHDGIRLVLDGKDIGALPQELKGLPAGDHSIVFEGGDRYAAQKSVVSLAPNQTKEIELVSLKVTKGAATFDVRTPGTQIALVAPDERRALSDYSRPIDIDVSKSWTLEASKTGFRTLTMPIHFDDEAQKTFVVTLTEPAAKVATDNTPPAPHSADDTAGAAKGGSRGSAGKTEPAVAKNEPSGKTEPAKADRAAAATTTPAAKAQPAAAAPAPVKAAAGGNCTLNINSIPTSKITLDGRLIGLTPKVGVSVTAGTHSVMMITDTARKATTATCKAGETKTVAVRITQ